MVDLKRLSHLVTLAEERHFARAAERVHLSQPAFSRSIQLLESQVGMRLFDRESGDVKPTPAGLFLVDRARRLLFDARSLKRDVELYRDTQLGDAAFGAGPFPATTIMPLVVTALRREYPGVGLRLETGNWQSLLECLLDESIEFFVAEVRDIPDDPRIDMVSVGRQAGSVFARKDHPLAGRRCSVAEAWSYGIASTRWPQAVKVAVGRLVGLPAGQVPVLAVECDDFTVLRTLAAETDTLLALSEACCRADVRAGVLVPLDLVDLPDVYSEMGIVTLANRTPSPMASRAIGCVQAVARDVNTA